MRAALLTLLPLLCKILIGLGMASSSVAVAQDRKFTVNSTSGGILAGWSDVTLTDADKPGATSGAFDKHGGGLTGWRWTQDGNDYIIRDGSGRLMFTMSQAANQTNTTGSCVDNPSTDGDYGGTWTKA
jgi:hypothetical protein